MSNGLQIPANGGLDLVSLGALVHRLDPGVIPFRKASECRIHVSGGEFNVAANLSDCFRLRTGIVSAMVGLLSAPKNTGLYKRLKKENRLIKEFTGNM